METTHKTFKPFDKVIFRPKDESYMWICGLFSNYDGNGANIIGYENVLSFDEYNILPYEGNEHLVGTADEPEEGEWIVCSTFNPADLDETKKYLLCVKNGKIVKYKSF